MNFGNQLLKYMDLLNISTKELCEETKLSYSVINRYINNTRKPKEDSKYFSKIVDAIYQLSIKTNSNLTKDSIYESLKKSLINNESNIDYDLFVDNFNRLQNELDLTTVEIAKAVGYDSSFVSRIKNNERKPSDLENFIDKLRTYIISICNNNHQKRTKLSIILNCSENDLNDINFFKEKFDIWICSQHIENKDTQVLNFLTKLDNFDLNDYVGTDFSKIKVPTMPVMIRNSKMYFGINGRKQSEGDFLKITLLSKSDEPIFFYSDLPISSAGEDEEFKKKWVFAMTRILKKGLHLNMVHNLDRPINELLLGLENWIPMYMSGSISPYYFKETPSNFFNCSHCTSGSVALSSKCINNNEKKSKFYLTTKKEEVEFEKEISKIMISKATPLMKIYKKENKKEFEKFLNQEDFSNNKKIEKSIFKNIDFYINPDNNYVIINKKTSPEMHFVIFHEKLIKALNTFLTT